MLLDYWPLRARATQSSAAARSRGGLPARFAAGQEPDLETNPALRWMRKHLRLLPDYEGNAMSVKRDGVRWFTPLFAVLILIAVTFLLPPFASIGTLAMLIMMLFMAIEGVYLGKMVNRLVRERFPDSADGGWKLGWYAFSRASQIKKMRLPKPRVKPGDAV